MKTTRNLLRRLLEIGPALPISVVLLLVVCGVARAAFAGSLVDQGNPGFNPWVVRGTTTPTGPDGGAVVVQDLPCTAPVESVILFDGGGATCIPVSALAGRRTVTSCNSPKNAGSPQWTIRADGTAPTTALGSPGQGLGVGDCVSYTINATSADGGCPLYGIADTNNAALTTTECK